MIHDVIVIGAGIVGCAIARELSKYDLKVLILEKEHEVGFGTSKSNSGIIHAGHHASVKTLKGRLEWAGNPLWDDLAHDLGFGFKRVGELNVAFTEEDVAVVEHLHVQGLEKGVPGMEIWDQERVRREEPNLSHDILAALFVPTTGVINPYEACFALMNCALQNGARLAVDQRVIDIRPVEVGLEVRTPSATYYGRYVINCAGLFSDEVAAMVGAANFVIKPRKGEEYMLDKRLSGFVKRVIFPVPTPVSKGILIIPTYDGTIMVGPTAEYTHRYDLTTTNAGCEQVFNAVRKLAPGISEKDVIAEFAGLRAVADTEDFVIGPTLQRGFINVAGIQSPGLTSSPAIATLVIDILKGEGLSLQEKVDFKATVPKPARFRTLSTKEQAALSEHEPAYGHVICRCETITEQEVREAIRQGARTLDGIKFRTRAGMGRCQGAFCTWRCIGMLSRELGIPLNAVTKRGGGSWLVCQPADLAPEVGALVEERVS